ncbi:MAG: hypothetical protein JKY94_17765 [Rhodobacteraceae bacterium]|nr:hypothetical protein [Paracoccaceae bacterium]
MPKIYYSKSKRGFFSDHDFGTLRKDVPDPAWKAPTIPDPTWEGEDDAPLVTDPGAKTPTVSVVNEDCKLPSDAVEITPAQHSAFLSPEAGRFLVHPSVEDEELLPFFKTRDPIPDRRRHAQETRNAAIEAPLLLGSSTFQVDRRSRDNMRNAIEYATRNGIDASTTRDWVLYDNTVRAVTVAVLGEVLDGYTLRMDALFTAYKLWEGGDMGAPFAVKE